MSDVRLRAGFTYADLDELPETRYPRYELIDGEIVVTPSAVPEHERVCATLTALLWTWARPRAAQVYCPSGDIRIAGHDVIADVALVLAEHRDHVGPKFHVAPPDVTIEVYSPGTAIRDLNRKRDLYAEFGVPEYWFADLRDRSLLVHRLAAGAYGPPQRLGPDDALTSPQLPGFTVVVGELFA